MSLLATVKAGVETAFTIGSEFVTTGIYLRHSGATTYDPATDTETPAHTPVANVRFLKTAAEVTEREASPIAISDVKFIIPSKDLPVGFKPGGEDRLQPGDGQTYNVITSKFVPGDAIHIVFGRRA